MGLRSELHTLLLTYANNVYHQPPPGIQMVYPCIVYGRDNIDTIFADNLPYMHKKRYQVTIIDANPDSEIPDEVAKLPSCSFDRAFTAGNLNHVVYNLYF
jgi:hypothetical protein